MMPITSHGYLRFMLRPLLLKTIRRCLSTIVVDTVRPGRTHANVQRLLRVNLSNVKPNRIFDLPKSAFRN